MNIAIMQPYLFPYIGYWQLINAADVFVVYDDIQYTKKGWINRNRIFSNGKPMLFSIPLKSDSDFLDVKDRIIANNADKVIAKILRQIMSSYIKSPYFSDVYPLIESCFKLKEENLFKYILNSILCVCDYLKLNTKIIVSSELKIDREQKGKDRVIATCKKLNASCYINAIGGMGLYDRECFKSENVELFFLKTLAHEYQQYNFSFVNGLSIIDLLMFCSISELKEKLEMYELI